MLLPLFFFKKSKKYYTVILIFGMGAALGYITSDFFGIKSILIAAAFLTISFIILFFEERAK